MGGQSGQATVEWTALLLAVALALGELIALAPAVDARSLGGLVLHRIVCAARSGCDDGGPELVAAYGERGAALVRAHAPGIVYEPGTLTLPVDFRTCREHGPACTSGSERRPLMRSPDSARAPGPSLLPITRPRHHPALAEAGLHRSA